MHESFMEIIIKSGKTIEQLSQETWNDIKKIFEANNIKNYTVDFTVKLCEACGIHPVFFACQMLEKAKIWDWRIIINDSRFDNRDN